MTHWKHHDKQNAHNDPWDAIKDPLEVPNDPLDAPPIDIWPTDVPTLLLAH